MELVIYVITLCIASILALNRVAIHNKILFLLLFFTWFAILSALIRTKPQGDIAAYISAMDSSTFNLYYLREPILWLPQRFLFNLSGSSYLTFILTDVTAASILFLSMRALNSPQYLYFAILASFPFILGMQNVYRQWIATLILMYSVFSLVKANLYCRSILTFIASGLTHNACLIFLPLLPSTINQKDYPTTIITARRTLITTTLIVSFLGILVGGATKSSASTGADLQYIYPIILLIVSTALTATKLFMVSPVLPIQLRILWITTLITFLSAITLESAAAGRVGLISASVVYVSIAWVIELRRSGRYLLRLALCWGMFIPILLGSPKSFILE